MGKPNYYPDPNKNPYRVSKQPTNKPPAPSPKKETIDFNSQRICPSCGKLIKASHNFCKYCGVDLSAIDPIGRADRTLKELAATALTDPNADVRKDAVDTLGEFGEHEVLGVLAYVLLNDPDENVRKKAADELGDLHHPISLEVLAKGLKDRSPIVRKEAIEGLKKIKKKNKPKEQGVKEEDIKKRPEEKEPEQKEEEIIKEEDIKEEYIKEQELIKEQDIKEELDEEADEEADKEEEIEEYDEEEKEIEEEEMNNEDGPLKEIEPQDDEYYKL